MGQGDIPSRGLSCSGCSRHELHGCAQVGKSLLIRCLIKHYTRQGLAEVRGPLTVVSGKQRRLTFVECPQVSDALSPCALVPPGPARTA